MSRHTAKLENGRDAALDLAQQPRRVLPTGIADTVAPNQPGKNKKQNQMFKKYIKNDKKEVKYFLARARPQHTASHRTWGAGDGAA